MKRTIKEWIDFLRDEENATFAVEDENGVYARFYFPADEALDLYADWINLVPVKVWYNNNREGGTKFIVNAL